ncbi:nucleoside hydrolase [Komagataeibacter rhaeticus]|uniref:nucleoside hydrolase n=1 Tax=Komagataeibacter rhaeticus TaxID=215221 RepID=UPI000D8582D0|nr:nucleoside hydrolase [Komagataeibacter rhaeticus]MBL7239241.1 nucleoside hydrolase [Komagataeibacter rhaeticus]PYD52492.1 nucleoside hydrolase [Komagataeibacter rhaeticus]GBQ12042.1 inosine-uridine preferring nucleoside hydrolase [Komagataeibacter rhaeticus DSM 16663]
MTDLFSRRYFLAATGGLLAGGLARPAPLAAAAPSPTPRKVIVDADIGVDDTMALLLVHFAPEVEIIGITTVNGNGTLANTTRNALFLAEKFGIQAPVAKGAGISLDNRTDTAPTFIHGDNAMGNITLPTHLTRTVDGRPAWQMIVDMVRAHPHEVTILGLGRLTNLALALRHDPAIAGLTREVIVMGGGFGLHGDLGNVTPAAEANFRGDPLAADLVCGAAWPMTIVGVDVTFQTTMTDAYLQHIRDQGGAASALIWDVTRFYMAFHKQRLGLDAMYVNDASASAYLLRPELFRTRRGAVRVVCGGVADGESIQKPAGKNFPPNAWDNRPEQSICTDVDSDGVRALFAQTLRGH